MLVRIGETHLDEPEVGVAQVVEDPGRNLAGRARLPDETPGGGERFHIRADAFRFLRFDRGVEFRAEGFETGPVVVGALLAEEFDGVFEGRHLFLLGGTGAQRPQPVGPAERKDLLPVFQDALPDPQPGDLLDIAHVALGGAVGHAELALDRFVGDPPAPEEQLQEPDDPVHGLHGAPSGPPPTARRRRGSAGTRAVGVSGNNRRCSTVTNRSVIPAM